MQKEALRRPELLRKSAVYYAVCIKRRTLSTQCNCTSPHTPSVLPSSSLSSFLIHSSALPRPYPIIYHFWGVPHCSCTTVSCHTIFSSSSVQLVYSYILSHHLQFALPCHILSLHMFSENCIYAESSCTCFVHVSVLPIYVSAALYSGLSASFIISKT